MVVFTGYYDITCKCYCVHYLGARKSSTRKGAMYRFLSLRVESIKVATTFLSTEGPRLITCCRPW